MKNVSIITLAFCVLFLLILLLTSGYCAGPAIGKAPNKIASFDDLLNHRMHCQFQNRDNAVVGTVTSVGPNFIIISDSNSSGSGMIYYCNANTFCYIIDNGK
jgi:hypothetical protein